MASLLICISFVLFFCFSPQGQSLRGDDSNDTDHEALLKFKEKITGDPLGVMNSWNNSVRFCQWPRITCDPRNGRVTRLELRSLDLVGSLSPYVGNLSFLRILDLRNNRFSHEIPSEIGRLFRLQELLLTNNSISGIIPYTISRCSKLKVFVASFNQLVGSIPPSIGTLSNLQSIFLDVNGLSGVIPVSFGNLSSLEQVGMAENRLTGYIPSTLGSCKNLLLLDVSRNNLTGYIPKEIFQISSLSIDLHLSRNRFTGALPTEVGNLTNLGRLTVAENMLFGKIPDSLGSCQSLERLDMSSNLFEGSIPASFDSLKGLQELNLSHNNLSGEIPNFLLDMKSLQLLDLSYNDLEGLVPLRGIFINATSTVVKGNKKLCGGISQLQLPKCSQSYKPKKWISAVSAFIGMAFLVIVSLFLGLRNKRKGVDRIKSKNFSLGMSYQSIRKVTNGFSPANLIGVGSFGSVYKGVLDDHETVVAIKVFNLLQPGASKSFKAECEALRNFRHRNLVNMLAVCSSIDGQGNDFMALVYELMSNGSLEEWLHPKIELNDSDHKPRNLDLMQRLCIAIDIARAVYYLHHEHLTPIVHCHLKPSNVLLDDALTGHLGDYGLVKFAPQVAQGSSMNDTSSVCIRGTVGYIAPEYFMGNNISTDGDVYSYGILLLEMFTGKRPTDDIFKEGHNLHTFAKGALPEHVMAIVDPAIISGLHENTDTTNTCGSEIQEIKECLVSILDIGLACSAELPRERMSISDVVAQLSSVKNKLLGAENFRRSS